MGELPGLWREHQNAVFPASAMRFVSIDVSLGALLTASLRTDGVPRPLPPEKREALARAVEEAVAALRSDLDPGARAYFTRLTMLGRAVLEG